MNKLTIIITNGVHEHTTNLGLPVLAYAQISKFKM